ALACLDTAGRDLSIDLANLLDLIRRKVQLTQQSNITPASALGRALSVGVGGPGQQDSKEKYDLRKDPHNYLFTLQFGDKIRESQPINRSIFKFVKPGGGRSSHTRSGGTGADRYRCPFRFRVTCTNRFSGSRAARDLAQPGLFLGGL